MTDRDRYRWPLGPKDTAALPEVKRLVFDFLARRPATGASEDAIKKLLSTAGHHPGAWYVLRREWGESIDVRSEEITNVRRFYSLKVGE